MIRIGLKALLSLLLIGGGSCGSSSNSSSSNSSSSNSSLPIVDLGYVRQQATTYNQTYDFFQFRNIRFAAPPLGELRFRKPQPPLPEYSIQNGNIPMQNTLCHQTLPAFLSNRTGFPAGVTLGGEDCLFLDVYVPACVKPGDNVPVLIWIYGGGYFLGGKDLEGDPARLIKSADKPMIYVSINYRLGSFGWLSPPSEPGIDKNIGLHDSRAGMEWVKKHISKFGGSPDKVTVMGESAGGGVIMHTVTSYGGGGGPLPFQKAIIQSPGFDPKRTKYAMREAQYEVFMKSTNCTTLRCLRNAPTEVVTKANRDLIMLLGVNEDIGTFGPAVDGDYVPDIPMRLLSQGRHHNLEGIISSNNGFEGGYLFPTPDTVMEDTFDKFLNGTFTTAPDSLKQRAQALYPYKGPGVPEWMRVASLFGDTIFSCNARLDAKSFRNSYRYLFEIPPADHGDDVAYTFYTGPSPDVANETAAIIHQQYITNFAIHGDPGCAKGACFPKYGRGVNTLSMNITEIKVVRDPWAAEKCDLMVELAEFS